MRPCHGLNVNAPSSSLLRFLRAQSEELCFFTPSTASQISKNQGIRSAPCEAVQRAPNGKRAISTTSRNHATVESSLFPLDFFRTPRPSNPPSSNSLSTCRTHKLRTLHERPDFSRHGSTDSHHLLKRLWKQKERKEKPNLKSTDLPPLPSFLDDYGGTNISRNKSLKAANELKLRCTEFDKDGKVTLMDGEFKKTELIAKV